MPFTMIDQSMGLDHVRGLLSSSEVTPEQVQSWCGCRLERAEQLAVLQINGAFGTHEDIGEDIAAACLIRLEELTAAAAAKAAAAVPRGGFSGKPKTTLSVGEFMQKAGKVKLTVQGETVTCTPMEFKTGSFGWNMSGKIELPMPDGTKLWCQLSGNAVAIGSKPE